MINTEIINEIQQVYEKSLTGEYMIVRSPGRINIIGEHTDYNEGLVLPGAIDKATYLAIGPRTDDTIKLIAHDLKDEFVGSVKNIRKTKKGWPNYILGVVDQFLKKNINIPGFNAVISSDIPIGAGLSSSAALECAVAYALNELTQAGLERISLVKMAQKAEHEYAGVMCGIMDQFASMMGKADHLIKLDCRNLEYQYVPFLLADYDILLLNTNVKHSLASSEYNIRRNECQQAVSWVKEFAPEIMSLRDVNAKMLKSYVKPKDEEIYKRSLYIVEEIGRLFGACDDLMNDNLTDLGKKMKETHYGLSQMYNVSCKELDFLFDLVKHEKSVVGSRLMGGGFGGCTINIVEKDKTNEIIEKIKIKYENEMNLPLDYYVTSIQDGTNLIKAMSKK